LNFNHDASEKVRDSPVPWLCRAECQHISFQPVMALRPCVQRRNLEDSSAARRAPAMVPVRPGAPGEVSRRKKHRIFLENFSRKIRRKWRKIRFCYTGPSAPRQLSRGSNEDDSLDFDDLRDYMEQNISAGQFQKVSYCRIWTIEQFLNEKPDLMNMTPHDLNPALESLPIPVKRLISPGISPQEAVQVNQGHDTYKRQYQD
jgi:hypothetical protein